MITPQNLVRHELIGLKVRVIAAKDAAKKGLAGAVIDETQKTLTIRLEKNGERMVAKRECAFEFELPDGRKVEVDGRMVFGRPEERIKKKLPGKWETLKK